MREETDLRLGIEMDFVAGRESRIDAFLDAREWDYVVGSVHFVGDARWTSRARWDRVWGRGDRAERIWERYFATLAEAAGSGLYDIMAHPDLVEVCAGGRRRAAVRSAIRASCSARGAGDLRAPGVAMEMSTAGLRKPAGELYPAPALLEMAVDAGLPIRAVPPTPTSTNHSAASGRRRRRARGRGRDRDLRVRGPPAAGVGRLG